MFSLIAAMSENRVIGSGGKIPWRIPGEQRYFRDLTWGHTIVMGRRSFQEIGKPLPGRRTIVLSRTGAWESECCTTCPDFSELLPLSAQPQEIFIAGGEQIYRLALPLARRIYLTVIHRQVEGDAYFPEFSEQEFQLLHTESYPESGYTRCVYERM